MKPAVNNVPLHCTFNLSGNGRKTRSTKDWKCGSYRLNATSTQGSDTSSSVRPILTKEFQVRVTEQLK
ncbi:hypothetical protein J6590_082598 [Homalodisca vitripennis]|nr:hypothetical protein J6590_082598 [Homalodisca vitripennis]